MGRRIVISLVLITEVLVGQSVQLPHPGIHYKHRSQAEPPLSIHLVEIDPKLYRMSAARALNSGLGRETVSSIARRRGALIAVNGGFFAMGGRYDGDPQGPLKIGNEWFSDSSLGRGAIGWDPLGDVFIERISVGWFFETEAGHFKFDGLNQERRADQAVLYNWAFHRSTLTDPGGREWLISDGIIQEVQEGGDSAIPVNGYVASFGPGVKIPGLQAMTRGAPIKIGLFITGADASVHERWVRLPEILGGTPVLLSRGVPPGDMGAERVRLSFIKERHPRTAVCITQDQKWLLVVVDGRQANLSLGMSLAELTTLLQAEGCHNALNLDGGGSTTLVIDNELKNSPSDFGVERPVSDALLVLNR